MNVKYTCSGTQNKSAISMESGLIYILNNARAAESPAVT